VIPSGPMIVADVHRRFEIPLAISSDLGQIRVEFGALFDQMAAKMIEKRLDFDDLVLRRYASARFLDTEDPFSCEVNSLIDPVFFSKPFVEHHLQTHTDPLNLDETSLKIVKIIVTATRTLDFPTENDANG
jgi:hypothetical protein